MVASAGPGRAIGRGEQRFDLLLVEECDERVGRCVSVGSRARVGCRGRVRDDAARRIGRANGSPRAWRSGCGRCCRGRSGGDRGTRRLCRRSRSAMSSIEGSRPQRVGGEPQQQFDRVAVGGDRVRAGVAFPEQPLGEERLHGRSERAHELASCAASSRCPAIAINSGAACKYQNVCLGWVWPIYVLSSGSLGGTSTPSRYQSSSVCTANRWRRS